MLEILILIALTNRIGKIVEAKGYKSAKYKWTAVGLWFSGEIIGSLLGIVVFGTSTAIGENIGIYIFAIIGALVGASIAYSKANNLEPCDDENQPIYYQPTALSIVASLAGISSWIILAGFLADAIVQRLNVQAQLQQQGLALSTLLTEPSFNSYAFTNLIVPLLTGLALFAILQGVSIGLNVLLEIDFNMREPKN